MAFVALAAALMISLVGCSEAMAKKVFMYGFEKAIGGEPAPIKLEREYIKVTLEVNLKVGKSPESLQSPFQAAYPQRMEIEFAHVQDKDKRDLQVISLEKWTNKTGLVSASATFARVYPGETIVVTYFPALYSSAWKDQVDGQLKPGALQFPWMIDPEMIVGLALSRQAHVSVGGTMAVRYSESSETYYVTITDSGVLGGIGVAPK